MITFFLSYGLWLLKGKSLGFLLVCLVLFTLVGALLIGGYPDYQGQEILGYLFYSILMFSLLIGGFSRYKNLSFISKPRNDKSFEQFSKFIIVSGLIAFFVNLYIVYNSFGLILTEEIKVEEFKNEGGAADYLVSWVGSGWLFLTRFLSPMGFLAIGLHFFYLVNGNRRRSLLFLIVSLNIPLQGLHALSRSSTTQYVLLYISYLWLVYGMLGKKNRRRVIQYFVIFTTLLVTGFTVITSTRFSTYSVSDDSVVKNSQLLSVLDYASQWSKHSFKTINDYEPSKMIYGKSSLPLYYYIRAQLGFEDATLTDDKIRVLGRRQSSKFNGVVASLLYDFGYVFSFLFAVIFYLVVVHNAPKNGKMSLISFLMLAMTLPLTLMFFSNNMYSYITIQLGMVYLLVFWLYTKLKF